MPSIKQRSKLFALLALLNITATAANALAEVEHRWSDASKDSVGTAYGRKSDVWFSTGQGVLNEVYFPTIDRAQVGDSQILIGFPNGFFLEERRDFTREITHPDGIPRPLIRARYGEGNEHVEFLKEVVTDPQLNVLRVRYRIIAMPEGAKVYILHKPTADNDGASDMGRVAVYPAAFAARTHVANMALFAWDSEMSHPAVQALISTARIVRASVGIVGETDGWQDLSRYGRMMNEIPQNGPSNIALTAELEPTREFEVVLGFGFSPDEALGAATTSVKTDFNEIKRRYDLGWQSYSTKLLEPAWLQSFPEQVRKELVWDAVLIKAHEDKQNPGAIVASLSIPSLPMGKGFPDGDKKTGGYHLIWPRDLFKSAIGLLRMGDVATALDALHFMMRMEHNGRMSQNAWTTGAPSWNVSQMDQEAFPVLLAFELVRAGAELDSNVRAFVDRRLARIRASGGRTEEERWEEVAGYSPNSIAVMAAALSRTGDQEGAAKMLNVLLSKTVSHHGPLSSDPYLIRIAQNGEPDAGYTLQIANDGPALQEYRVIDGGFMEWLRWFPRPEQYFGEQGAVLKTVIDNSLRVYDNPANGVASFINGLPLYRRYTADAYGLHHRGGAWPILTLERAMPEIIDNPQAAAKYYQATRKLWGTGDLCPEQVGPDLKPMAYAASPLVWCHAEMIELLYTADARTKVRLQPRRR